MQKLTENKQKNNGDQKWYLVDATNVRLGKLSAKVASLIIGKDKIDRVDYQLPGTGVVIINSDKISYYPTREKNKMYYRHSGFPGGFSKISLGDQMKKDSRKVLETAISGMLPKNKLRALMMKNVRIYTNDQHDQQAQNPEIIVIK